MSDISGEASKDEKDLSNSKHGREGPPSGTRERMKSTGSVQRSQGFQVGGHWAQSRPLHWSQSQGGPKAWLRQVGHR